MMMRSCGNIFCILFITFLSHGCKQDVSISEKPKAVQRKETELLHSSLSKFELQVSDELLTDSNSLIFLCSRTLDTTSMIHIRKSNVGMKGIYYEILPAYHKYADDYSDLGSDLLFFEGYSFKIDSLLWESIKGKAKNILQLKETLDTSEQFTDGSNYQLYLGTQSCFGNGSHQEVFEGFDTFLKYAFLNKFLQARKPKIYKTK